MFVESEHWKERDLLFSFQIPWPGPTQKVIYLRYTRKHIPTSLDLWFELWLQAALLSSEGFPTWHDSTGWESLNRPPPQPQMKCRPKSLVGLVFIYFSFISLCLFHLSPCILPLTELTLVFALFGQVVWPFCRLSHPLFCALFSALFSPCTTPVRSLSLLTHFHSLSSSCPLFLFLNYDFP